MMRLLVVVSLLLLIVTAQIQAVEQPNLPTNFDIIMLAGADYSLTVMIRDAAGQFTNMSTPSYTAQFRSTAYPVGTIFANFSAVRVRVPTTQKIGISLRLSKAQTNALSGRSGLWDLKQTASDGLVSYILTGKCSVKPTVSR